MTWTSPKTGNDKISKSLATPADPTSSNAKSITDRAAALRIVTARKRRLRAVRKQYGTIQFERAVELAESLGYDTSQRWGLKAVAYLMRVNLIDVIKVIDTINLVEETDSGNREVDDIDANALKPQL